MVNKRLATGIATASLVTLLGLGNGAQAKDACELTPNQKSLVSELGQFGDNFSLTGPDEDSCDVLMRFDTLKDLKGNEYHSQASIIGENDIFLVFTVVPTEVNKQEMCSIILSRNGTMSIAPTRRDGTIHYQLDDVSLSQLRSSPVVGSTLMNYSSCGASMPVLLEAQKYFNNS